MVSRVFFCECAALWVTIWASEALFQALSALFRDRERLGRGGRRETPLEAFVSRLNVSLA